VIRVESINIKKFRGIKNLPVEMLGKNFAICGGNGTGKSGIVDALEFVLTGGISRLEGKGSGGLTVKQHGPHVDSKNEPAEAHVTLMGVVAETGEKITIHGLSPFIGLRTNDRPGILLPLTMLMNH